MNEFFLSEMFVLLFLLFFFAGQTLQTKIHPVVSPITKTDLASFLSKTLDVKPVTKHLESPALT